MFLDSQPPLSFVLRTDIYGNILYLKSLGTALFYSQAQNFLEKATSLSQDGNFITVVQQEFKDFLILNANDGAIYGQCSVEAYGKVISLYLKSIEEAYIVLSESVTSIGKLNFTKSSYQLQVTSIKIDDKSYDPYMINHIGSSLYLYFYAAPMETVQGVLRFNLDDNKIYTSYTMNAVHLGNFKYSDYKDDPTLTNTRYHAIITCLYTRLNDKIYVTLLKEQNTDIIQSIFSTVKSYLITTINSSSVTSFASGIYIDLAAQQLGIGIFETQTLSAIGVLDFNQTGTVLRTFQIIYGSQNGVQITFTFFRFTSLNTGLLCGYIFASSLQQYPLNQEVGVMISIPKPYYFQMGTPETRSVQVLDETPIIKKSNTHVITYPSRYAPLLNLTIAVQPYYFSSSLTAKMNQPVEITRRKLFLPTDLPTHIIQYLGDNVQVIPLGNCSYNQTLCTDTVYTNYIQSVNASNLNSKFTYIDSTNTLFIGFSTDLSAKFTNPNLKYKYDNQYDYEYDYKFDYEFYNKFDNQYDYEFYNKFDNKYNYEFDYELNLKQYNFTVRAGGSAVLYLPDFFDPNGDQVTISAKHNGVNTDFFKFLDKNRMEFKAGLKQLGEQDIMIILTDNNIKPLSTKYRITVTVLQSNLIVMNNTDVVKSNLSDFISIQDNSKFKVQQITPTGLVTIKFENFLNNTNETQILQEIYESIRLQIEDQSITFNWTVVFAKDNVIIIKINFSNPLLVQQSGMDKTKLRIILTNPSLFFNTNTNKSMSYSTYVPPQLRDYDGDFVLKIALFFNNTFSSLLITQMGTQMIISQSLQVLWGFVNSQQLISHLPLYELMIPANLYYFFQLVSGSLRFDYLFSNLLVQSAFDIPNQDAYNDNFRDFGYDSHIAIENIGFNTFLLLMSPILIIVTLILQYLARSFPKFDQVMPFDTMLNNIMELINEGLVLFTGQILILFTDYDPNPEHRYMIGWVILSAIAFVSLLNMSLILKYRKIRHKQRIRQRSTIIAGKQHYQKIKSINRKLFIKYLTKSGSQVQTEKRG
eukprot:403362118